MTLSLILAATPSSKLQFYQTTLLLGGDTAKSHLLQGGFKPSAASFSATGGIKSLIKREATNVEIIDRSHVRLDMAALSTINLPVVLTPPPLLQPPPLTDRDFFLFFLVPGSAEM